MSLMKKLRFELCGWSKMVCPCCGYRFEEYETINKISIGDTVKYFHEDCLTGIDGKEALEYMGIEIEEVEI